MNTARRFSVKLQPKVLYPKYLAGYGAWMQRGAIILNAGISPQPISDIVI